MTNTNERCLFPDCEREANVRGLCLNHYDRASRLVRAGKTTWDLLISLGKCLPDKYGRGKRHGNVGDWFLDKHNER